MQLHPRHDPHVKEDGLDGDFDGHGECLEIGRSLVRRVEGQPATAKRSRGAASSERAKAEASERVSRVFGASLCGLQRADERGKAEHELQISDATSGATFAGSGSRAHAPCSHSGHKSRLLIDDTRSWVGLRWTGARLRCLELSARSHRRRAQRWRNQHGRRLRHRPRCASEHGHD